MGKRNKKKDLEYDFYAVGVRCAQLYEDEFEVRYYSYNRHYGVQAARLFLLGFKSVIKYNAAIEEIDRLAGEGINPKEAIDGSVYVDKVPEIKDDVWGK